MTQESFAGGHGYNRAVVIGLALSESQHFEVSIQLWSNHYIRLTNIDQDTKIDHFSIVFFVFNKALVPFVQIWAARKIIL